MADSSDRGAVIAAFLANIGIALAKFVAFLATGAASMAAEAVHSVADTADQGLLLLGDHRGRREPNEQHPFGYGRERYFWAFVVALVLFAGGGCFALLEAEEKLRRPHELGSAGWSFATLAVAFVLEAFSLRTAVRRARAGKESSWWRFIRTSKRAELPVVLLEDSAALLGLVFAAIGIGSAELTGNSRFDALGSLAIGLLLIAVAATLAAEMKSLLIGESADPALVECIQSVIEGDEGVVSIVDLRTVQLSPDRVLITSRIEVAAGSEVTGTVERIEARLRMVVPRSEVYLHPQHVDHTRG